MKVIGCGLSFWGQIQNVHLDEAEDAADPINLSSWNFICSFLFLNQIIFVSLLIGAN